MHDAATRPISTTTTATHSTITPLPSDSFRNRLNAARHALNAPQDDGYRFPTSEQPSVKPKLSFFGISLSRRSSANRTPSSSSSSEPAPKSSRRRSFKFTSRPTTPKSLDDSKSPYSIPVPSSPLPLSASPRRRSFGLGSSQRSTPKSSASHLPLPHAQITQTTRAHGRRHSVGSERPPHDSAVALSEESSHRGPHKPVRHPPDRNKGKERERPFPDGPPPDLRPPLDPLSQNYPASRVAHPVFSSLPTVDSASSEDNGPPASYCSSVIPRIIHTPPTPQRPAEMADSSSGSGTRLPMVGSVKTVPAKPKTVTIAHREHVLVSGSQSHTDPQPASKGRFTPRIFGGRDLPKIYPHKSTKRPPAEADDPSASTTNVARNMTNHCSKLGSFDFERPVSALNRSSSTVDRQGARVQKVNSYFKSRFRSLERSVSESVPSDAQAEPAILSHIKPVHTGDTSVISFSSLSVQTTSTGKGTANIPPAGQSSSWGRASARRIMRTSHGTFAFEHPSSSVPNSPSPPVFNLPIGSNQTESSVSSSQPIPPLHDSRAKHSRGQSYNASDRDHSKPGERKPKGKGRSLDLGLGLSWAPSRVREEALMPGLILAREKARLEKGRANGLDVTKVFERVLSESQFQTFKEYVHRFDAHIIPLKGPSGLLARVEKLLGESSLGERERRKLMSDFTIFVQSHAG